jgi:uncharacterized membrane protein YcaP (DUF421 family)
MALIFIRTGIIYITLLIVMRLMGKSQIGEMQPFEFVITLLIAELACIPMADSSIPLLYGIIAIVAIFILHQIMWLLNLWFKPVKSLVCGKPSVVITRDGIDERELKRNNLDISDVVESMRSLGYFSLDDVLYGLYEANGSFSALENPQKNTETLSLTIVDLGKLDRENLKKCGIEMQSFESFLKSEKAILKDVLVMTVSAEGRVYFQKRGEKYKICHIEVGRKW